MVGGDVGDGAVRAGAHGGAVRAMRGVGAGCEDGEVGPPAGAHRVGGQALCGSGPTPRLPCSRALSRSTGPLREQGRAWTVEEGDKTHGGRGAWMAAAEEARGGPRRRRRSARLDGDEGGEAERARRTATRAVRRRSAGRLPMAVGGGRERR